MDNQLAERALKEISFACCEDFHRPGQDFVRFDDLMDWGNWARCLANAVIVEDQKEAERLIANQQQRRIQLLSRI